MSQKLQSVRGTQDILPEEFAKHRHIIDTARKVGALYGFKEMATPIFEFTEVFKRTLGETSDVVNKEMYTFEDKGGESITLRPEFTAGIARAFISNGLQQNLPLKFFSTGPLFRYERPQKGRYRQFHQINFEWLGNADATADIDIILLAVQILDDLGILPKVELELNTLGDIESRKNYTSVLVDYLKKYEADLSEDSKIRLYKNPLRILDSKDEGDKRILANAPKMKDSLTPEAEKFFNKVYGVVNKMSYDAIKLKVTANDKIVRGLDYYTHTVFEFVSKSDEMGSQNTVLAGGRYDGLIKSMGGLDTPAIGFAAGIERLALMLQGNPVFSRPIAVIPIGDSLEIITTAMRVATILRVTTNKMVNEGFNGLPVEPITHANLKRALKKANNLNASHAIIIGDEELEKGLVKLKDLDASEQEAGKEVEISIKDLIEKWRPEEEMRRRLK